MLPILALVTLAGPQSVDSNYEIVPGERIGNTSLGFVTPRYRALLRMSLAKRQTTADTAMGHTWYVWRGKTGHELDVFIVRGAGDRAKRPEDFVQIVRITSPSFQTSGGIKVGTPLPQIERRFPVEEVAGSARSERIFDAKAQGIAFEAKNGVCSAIYVHPQNARVARPNLHTGASMQGRR